MEKSQNINTITKKTDVKLPAFEKEHLSKIGLISSIISRYQSPYFQHIFSGGYGAGYYSYTWAAVLDKYASTASQQGTGIYKSLFFKGTASKHYASNEFF